MSILADILLVVIFIGILAFFSKYGLVKALMKIGKSFLSFFCAMVLGPWVAGRLEVWFMRRLITDGVHTSLVSFVEQNANGYNLAEVFEHLPEGFVKFLNGLGASLDVLEAEYGSYTEAGEEILREMAERIADPCIGVASGVIGYLVCFFVPLLVMWWLGMETRKNTSHPIFRFFDHVGGFLVGLVLAYSAVLLLSVFAHTVFQIVLAFDSSSTIMEIYQESYIFKFLKEFDTLGALQKLLSYIPH